MPPAILLIVQYALQFGIPAALEIVKLFQKTNPTLADWEAAFAVAQTPYGLTPHLSGAGVIDLGVVPGIPTQAVPSSGLAEFDVPPGTFIITKVIKEGLARTICNAAARCWYLPVGPTSVTPDPNGEIWTFNNQRWFVMKSALA